MSLYAVVFFIFEIWEAKCLTKAELFDKIELLVNKKGKIGANEVR